ncbi:TetR family transcriptional regulator [Rhodospirillum rubrum]|uniref:TetR/AcrR family transcriptional regulator n=1 Tax=Rhodospirillum rubrum TaxID=1085 RepID=UPI001907F8EC|nr:TetR/AcrR family transcriptional regulator [Rhodospirillum rubrum]MBK1664190.1 TetR family transcriptional regulator [Rhodospirillum rubrum]MBK1675789.1 TetR family transcriptional regulator [Rhodospirillum rubrum]
MDSLLPRLDGASPWIEAALEALTDGGATAVRIEALAKRLGVTKGGFYWHFRDRADLLGRVLEAWKDGRIAALGAAVSPLGDESPRDRLIRLFVRHLEKPNLRSLALELAIRDWARADGAAAATVEAVDANRMARVSAIFELAGFTEPEARRRARLFYAMLFGQALVSKVPADDPVDRTARDCVDLLMGGADWAA